MIGYVYGLSDGGPIRYIGATWVFTLTEKLAELHREARYGGTGLSARWITSVEQETKIQIHELYASSCPECLWDARRAWIEQLRPQGHLLCQTVGGPGLGGEWAQLCRVHLAIFVHRNVTSWPKVMGRLPARTRAAANLATLRDKMQKEILRASDAYSKRRGGTLSKLPLTCPTCGATPRTHACDEEACEPAR
jgi:hypothetical protein